MSARFIRLHDADGDGSLAFDESGMDRKAFERLDANGDGKISREEYQQALLGGTGGVSK